MSKKALDIADEIIMDAFRNGMSIADMGDNLVVKHRLNLFGKWISGAYYLNERGFDYALSGCRKGLIEHIERLKTIDDLTIKVQSFSAKKQKYTFWIAVIGCIAAIGQIIGSIIVSSMK